MKVGLNTLLITHIDLDAAGCAIMFVRAGGRSENIRYCRIGTPDLESALLEGKSFAEVLIADITPPKSLGVSGIEALIQKGIKVYLLDHHESAQYLEVYPWARIDTGHSAAYLVGQELNLGPDDMAFATRVEDHDLWFHKDPQSSRLNLLLSALGMARLVERYSSSLSEFDDSEESLVKSEERRRQTFFIKYLKNVRVSERGGIKYGVGFVDEDYISEAAHFVLDELGLGLVVFLELNAQRVHLRSKAPINVRKIAVLFGGGGHPQAAGFGVGTIEGQKLFAIVESIKQELADGLLSQLNGIDHSL